MNLTEDNISMGPRPEYNEAVNAGGMPGMCFRAIPSPIMKISRTHPRAGKVCHIFTFSDREAILPQYLSTILRNIRKNAVRTAAVSDTR